MHRLLGKRARWGAALAVVLAVGSYAAIRLWRPDVPKGPPPVQVPVSASAAKIVVGPNVHVSAPYASDPHRETVIAADPLQARRLFAFAICDRSARSSIVGYLSEDGGTRWQVAFERQAAPGQNLSDPSLAFGPDGELYFVCLHEKSDVETGDAAQTAALKSSMLFFRCSDRRNQWEQLASVHHDNPDRPQDPALAWQVRADRPWLTVDATTGKNRGRLYCASWLWLDSSADQGRNFASLPQPVRKAFSGYMPANPVVLSDGTLLLARRVSADREHNLPGIGILMSDDGGQTLGEGPLVGTDRYDERFQFFSSNGFQFTVQLAADTSSSEFRDRIYAVWEDGQADTHTPSGQPERPGRGHILFAFSKDKGRTWVGPMILSEQPDDAENSFAAYIPAIAVNKAGALAVTWYDRRGLPTAPGSRPPFNGPGCNVRIRVSLDGGETWQPSVQMNEKTIKASVWELRDTAGLAADADGTFHPTWIDDRTGTTQVWTAAVGVEKR